MHILLEFVTSLRQSFLFLQIDFIVMNNLIQIIPEILKNFLFCKVQVAFIDFFSQFIID